MATHSSILPWKIPWMEEPGRLQSMGSDTTERLTYTRIHYLALGIDDFMRVNLCQTLKTVHFFQVIVCQNQPQKNGLACKLKKFS